MASEEKSISLESLERILYALKIYVDDRDNNLTLNLENLEEELTAYIDSKIKNVTDRIAALEELNMPCTGISLNNSSLTFTSKNAVTLKATLTPSNTTDVLSWSSDNVSVATVTASGINGGIVTPVASGSCNITARCGNISVKCPVTVKLDILCNGVTLNYRTLSFTTNTTKTLKATLTPSNTTQKLTWGSSDETVAKVSSSGVVTPVANGTCRIIATCGSEYAVCSVTVANLSSTSYSNDVVTLNPKNLKFTDLNPQVIVASVKGLNEEETTNVTITWKSSNTSVATVSSKGVVTPKKSGSCTITANCGTAYATCSVTINL